MSVNVENLLKEFAAVKTRRAPWEPMLELVARYVFSRKQGFSGDSNQGEFFTSDEVFDDTAALALGQMVSSVVGALWKNGARTFKIVRPEQCPETETIKTYYKEINRRLVSQIEHPKAGFGTSFQEYMLENGAFGTSGMGVFATKSSSDHRLDYRAMGIKHMWVCEDASGRVVKIFYEVELDASQLVDEYGTEVLAIDVVKAAYETFNFEKKFKVLWVMRPRKEYDPTKLKNNQNMPIESIHILEEMRKELRQSGFRDLPIKVTRFYKNEGEEYGRSPAMEALPTIVDLNAFWEMVTKGTELSLDPSLYLLDDGSFGGGILDRSPGSLNVLDVSSRISNTAPIGVVGTVGEMQSAVKMIEALTGQVIKHFFVDRLLDLNNQTRMTLGEAQIRNELRADSLGAIFNRQMDECLTPVLQRSIGLMVEAGEFGVVKGSDEEKQFIAAFPKREPLYVPDELVELDLEKVEIYNIEYVSPAMRVLRSEELRGIMSTWQFAGAYGQAIPEFLIMLDKKISMRRVAELTGATDDIFLSEEKFQEAMTQYQGAKQQEQQMMMEKVASEIAAKRGSAAQQNAQAAATAQGGPAAGGQGMGGGMLI